MSDIFTGTSAITAFYGPTEKGTVAVKITRGNATSGKDTTYSTSGTAVSSDGFLVEQYQVVWGRPIQIKRFFNRDGGVAIVGFGQGTCTLTGLVGTYAGFNNLAGGSDKNADLCKPLQIEISGASGMNVCSNGETSTGENAGCGIQLKHCYLQQIQITGQILDNGTQFQQANCSFQVGQLSIVKASKAFTYAGDETTYKKASNLA